MTSSFKLYNESSLTTEFSGTLELTHETDQSDNPQDFQLWLGSTETSRTLEASSNPGVDNITLTPTDALDAWVASTAYTLGQRVQPTTPNGFVYECTTAGTSDSGEPTWPTTVSQTVVDNTAVWTCVAAKHPTTEIKLALTAAGLPGATAGAALSLGTSISSGSGGAVEVNIRVTNAVTTVIENTGYPEITLDINECIETG